MFAVVKPVDADGSGFAGIRSFFDNFLGFPDSPSDELDGRFPFRASAGGDGCGLLRSDLPLMFAVVEPAVAAVSAIPRSLPLLFGSLLDELDWGFSFLAFFGGDGFRFLRSISKGE